MNIRERLEKLGTPALSDALDSMGISGGIVGVTARGKPHCVGRAFTVLYGPIAEQTPGFKPAGEYIDEVLPGDIIVIDNNGSDDATTWGGILTEFAVLKKIAGTVVHGAARDLERVRELAYPLYSTHAFMQSAKNRSRKLSHQKPLRIGRTRIEPGDWVCADESGCLVIPQGIVAQVIARAEAVERTESRIVSAVRQGMSLAMARREHGYHEPWKG